MITALIAVSAVAGQDDDSPFQGDGKTRNALDPIYFGGKLADFPMNAEPETGLRIMPPTGSDLFAGQRFDLRVETQIPAREAPRLVSLTVNGREMSENFLRKVAAQGAGSESGTPSTNLLFGTTARNLSFGEPGQVVVEAVLAVDGVERRIRNRYVVEVAPNPSRTTAFDSIITDSAPGMASLVSGMKQSNNALQVSADNTPENPLDNPRIETVFEYMKRVHGWKIGVVTDAFLVDATPAALDSHNRSRRNYLNIAQQMIGYYDDQTALKKTGYASLAELSRPLDVLMGGGAAYWMLETNPMMKSFYQYRSGGRKDVDLLSDVAPKLGYSVVHNVQEMDSAPTDKKLIGIFTGEFRPTSSGLGADNLPGTLDRLIARGSERR